jgi:hypothetical protein
LSLLHDPQFSDRLFEQHNHVGVVGITFLYFCQKTLISLDVLVRSCHWAQKAVICCANIAALLFEHLKNLIEELLGKLNCVIFVSSLVPGGETVLVMMETPFFDFSSLTEVPELPEVLLFVGDTSRITEFLGVSEPVRASIDLLDLIHDLVGLLRIWVSSRPNLLDNRMLVFGRDFKIIGGNLCAINFLVFLVKEIDQYLVLFFGPGASDEDI